MDISPSYRLGRLMFELDRAADDLLHAQEGISYKRFIFLLVLQQCGTVTQHELAVALGYSDPAVSMMLVELAKDSYIQTIRSPEHGRKRLVSITSEGTEVVGRGRQLLDEHFDQLLALASVDGEQLREITERLYQALTIRPKKEHA
jgi:DNA-binding MarR family transcriptional regulator